MTGAFRRSGLALTQLPLGELLTERLSLLSGENCSQQAKHFNTLSV